MTMPMDVGPDGRVAIQVTPTETIFQPRSMSGNQHQRLVIGQYPVTHLRERMPDMRLIESDESFGIEVPILHYSITPLLHYSITPLLHYSITPLLHHSITPVLRRSI